MHRLKAPFAPYEATLLAAAPALAILVAYLYQFGSYGALNVPFELIELSTPKIVVSIIYLTFFFWFYAVVWIESRALAEPQSRYGILSMHLLLNVLMSAVFWFRPYASLRGNLLALLFFTSLFTSASLWARWIVKKRKDTAQPISLLVRSTFIGYCALLICFVSVVSGMDSEYKQTSRLVVKDKNLAFIGSYGGQYILMPYDPKTLIIAKGPATLMNLDGSLELERRKGVRVSR